MLKIFDVSMHNRLQSDEISDQVTVRPFVSPVNQIALREREPTGDPQR